MDILSGVGPRLFLPTVFESKGGTMPDLMGREMDSSPTRGRDVSVPTLV